MHKLYPQYNNCSVAEEEWEETVLAEHTSQTNQKADYEYATANGCMQEG
jgi:hypothetical protein